MTSAHVRMFLGMIASCLVVMGMNGCAQSAKRGEDMSPFNTDSYAADEEEIKAEIQTLRQGKYMDDPSSSAVFDDAVLKLTARGTMCERYLIEALRGDEDWGVRYGVIHVIDSVGTKHSIPALIEALKDNHPLVAQKSMYTLRVFCDHQIVPEVGTEVEAGSLPPIPAPEANDFERDAEYRQFSKWWHQHKEALYQAWDAWYDQHQTDVVLE